MFFCKYGIEGAGQVPTIDKAARDYAYRCGYRDGWMEAMTIMAELMFEHHRTRQQAYRMVRKHWDTALYEWAKLNWRRPTWPPELEINCDSDPAEWSDETDIDIYEDDSDIPDTRPCEECRFYG